MVSIAVIMDHGYTFSMTFYSGADNIGHLYLLLAFSVIPCYGAFL